MGQDRFDVLDGLDNVRAWLSKDQHADRGSSIGECKVPNVFERIGDLGYIGQSDGCTVAISDHQRTVIFGGHQLVGGIEGPLHWAFLDHTFWAIGIRGTDRGSDVLESDLHLIQDVGIEFDSNGRIRGSSRKDLADPVDLGELLLDEGRGQLIHLRLGVNLRDQRQEHDGRVGGVDLTVRGVVGKCWGQLASSRVDRRLNFSCRSIHIAVEFELKGDRGRP